MATVIQKEISQSPQTRCSNCQTVFEVPSMLLDSSDTRVRCGECMSIFDALEGLRPANAPVAPDEKPGPIKPPSATEVVEVVDSPDSVFEEQPLEVSASEDAMLDGLNGNAAALDVTYADFDLFSEDADLPEIVYLDQTRDTPQFDFDTVDHEDDETFNDTLFAHDVTVDADTVAGSSLATDVDFIPDQVPREALIFNYRDPDDTGSGPVLKRLSDIEPMYDGANAAPDSHTRHHGKAKRAWAGWVPLTIMSLVLCLLLGSLYAYRERNRLYNNSVTRPVLLTACSFIGCVVPSRVQLDELKLLKRTVYSHPTVPNALVINVAFRNTATFDQRYPLLIIRLSDRNGRSVAQREFPPTEYLDHWQAADTIGAGKELDISLEVSDPGQRAHSFELDFGKY